MLHSRDETNRALVGGIVGGVVGGLTMLCVLLILQASSGHDLWMAFKGAGAPFLHGRAMQPGFDPPAVVIGLVCQFAVSIAWGIPFGLLAYGLTRGGTVLFGALWGLVAWLGMYYVVLPIVGLGAMAASQPMLMAALLHVLFGLAVAFGFLPYQRTHIAHRHAFR
jgi:hypothetical protein